jgi:hypothetical protein
MINRNCLFWKFQNTREPIASKVFTSITPLLDLSHELNRQKHCRNMFYSRVRITLDFLMRKTIGQRERMMIPTIFSLCPSLANANCWPWCQSEVGMGKHDILEIARDTCSELKTLQFCGDRRRPALHLFLSSSFSPMFASPLLCAAAKLEDGRWLLWRGRFLDAKGGVDTAAWWYSTHKQ